MILACEALKIILEKTSVLGREEIFLDQSLNRILAEDVFATISLPSFDNSAMDGFALRWEETVGASFDHPVRFQVLETIPAGSVGAPLGAPVSVRARQAAPLQIHQAVRIMTGAPVPEWTDAVVPFEDCQMEGAAFLITQPVKKGANIRKAGEDIKQGEKVLEKGERVTSRSIALLAALGVGKIAVTRRPRVKILVTGNELVDVNVGAMRKSPLPTGKIFNSNGPALTSVLREIGIDVEDVRRSTDSEEELREVLKDLLEADVLITMGGVSAGDFDLVPKVLRDLGARTVFHKVAIKPGKPLLFVTFEKRLIFGLPGNPVSSWITFDRFVRPALLKMMGAESLLRTRRRAIVETDLKGSEGKEDYLRGIIEYREGKYFARLVGSQSSANLLGLARANAILVIPEDIKRVMRGEELEFEFLTEDL